MKTREFVSRVAFVLFPLATISFMISFETENSQQMTSYFQRNESQLWNPVERFVYRPTTIRTKCPVQWERYNVENEHVKPMIQLRRDRYLFPVLINGPNNQLVGFRKSIYIAIHLNRTIVIPKFFKHMSTNEIEPSHRVDLKELSKLVPFISIAQYREKCNNTADVVLRISLIPPGRYDRIQRITGLHIFTDKNSRKLNPKIVEYPINMTFASDKEIYINYNTQEMKNLYASKEACAIHPFQFSNIKVKDQKPKAIKPTTIDVNKITEKDLLAEITRFTPFPSHIKQLALDFLSDVMQNKTFLSVHWRYDEDDWMLRCKGKKKGSSKRQMCDEIRSITPSHIAEGITRKIKAVEEKSHVTNIYVASPPAQTQNILEVKKLLKKKYNYQLYTSDDVIAHWKGHFRSCDWLWSNSNDLLSSVEMEICSRGTVFLKSMGSSWSSNVALMRTEDVALLSGMDDRINKYIAMQRGDNESQLGDNESLDDKLI